MKNFIVVFLSLFLIFFSLSCSKDEDSVIDPTEEVVLTLKFSFQYLSTDISLKKVSAFLKLSEEASSVIVSSSANTNGRPNNLELVLRVSGHLAKEIIGKSVYVKSEVVYVTNNQEAKKEIGANIQIYGGEQSYNFSYEFDIAKKIEVVINSYFIYGNNVLLSEYGVAIRDPESNNPHPIIGKSYDIEDSPEKITTTLIIDGQEALNYINKELVIIVGSMFRFGSHDFNYYSEGKYFIAQEGVQEFDFYFCHPPSICD